ncbi:MAG: site-specific integrase [Chloroflexota bacterium]|nr:site-specific integrase [Chloroflexota bacterium]
MSDLVKAVTFDPDTVVSKRTMARLEESVPAATRRAYAYAWQRFTTWCAQQQPARRCLPASPQTLVEYVVHLTDDEGLSPATVEQAIAAIRREHRVRGHAGQPDTLPALAVLRAYKRRCADQGRTTRQAPPVTPRQVREMVDACDPTTVAGARDRLILVLGVSAMLRRSELAALTWADVTVTEDGLEVRVRASKTDQAGAGTVVAVPRGRRPGTCPVRVLEAYRAMLGEDTGPLLRRLSKGGRPLGPLSGDAVNDVVRAAAVRAGLHNAERITAHSLRASGATAAYKSGAAVSTIASHGRWAPGSPTVFSYVRAADRWSDNAMAAVDL